MIVGEIRRQFYCVVLRDKRHYVVVLGKFLCYYCAPNRDVGTLFYVYLVMSRAS